MISLFVNNSPSQNKIINDLGSQVTVNLNPSLLLDEKKNYHLRLLQANIVYSQPNIISGKNNQLTYKYTSSKITPQAEKTIVFETGLYTVDDINTKISLFMLAEEGTDNSDLITFYPDPSTSKIYAMYGDANVTIYCDGIHSILPLLGFPAADGAIGEYTTASYDISNNQANLNTIQNYNIKCDITTGTYENSQLSNIIASVIPDTQPYSTIIYKPFYPIRCPINVKRIESITITLTSQTGEMVDMGTDGGLNEPEAFSVLLTIESDELRLTSHNQS